MRRRGRCALLALVAGAATLGTVAAGTTGAQEAGDGTGVSGRVESVLSLSLQRIAPDHVRATVTATVGPTQLTVTESGAAPRTVDGFPRAVAAQRRSVRAQRRPAGVIQQTITLGPASP